MVEEFNIINTSFTTLKSPGNSDALVAGFYEIDKEKEYTIQDITNVLDINDNQANIVLNSLKIANFKGKFKSIVTCFTENSLILLIGLGKEEKYNRDQAKKLGGFLYTSVGKCNINNLLVCIDNNYTKDLILGFHLKSYVFDKYKKEKDEKKIQNITFYNSSSLEATFNNEILPLFRGIIEARALANEPPNVLNPLSYSEYLKSYEQFGIKITVLDENKLKELGMNLHLAVGAGALYPPCSVILEYYGDKGNDTIVGLLGKGLCFDSGGLSIKTGGHMRTMKFDMCGSAAVVGSIKTLALRKAKVNIVGIVGLAENAVDERSYRVDDVITSMSMQTVEVLNTDAEGRLVMADNLTYIQKNFKLDCLIDFATLTGAVANALGGKMAGVFSNSEEFGKKTVEAANEVGEHAFLLPIDDMFGETLKSDIADFPNIGTEENSLVTATKFLEKFIEKDTKQWAHFDIAGVANGKYPDICNKGGTGYGVAFVDNFVRNNYENK